MTTTDTTIQNGTQTTVTAPTFSPAVVEFFDYLLDQMTLAVGGEDFEMRASQAIMARRELRAVRHQLDLVRAAVAEGNDGALPVEDTDA